jgi:superfamily II RNA helicase
MVKKKVEAVQPEVDEPMTADELLSHLLEDLILDNEPADLASEFVENFVLRERDETPAILAMFDAPTETLLEMVKTIVEQSYLAQLQIIDERGSKFLESLKAGVKAQMIELSN